MDKKFILSKGWEISTWYGNSWASYIHKNFNIVNDGFFIEMKVMGTGVSIHEETSLGRDCIFSGELRTNEDLETIMRLLDFDFTV